MKRILFLITLLALISSVALSQGRKKKDERFIDVSVGPSLGFRVLGSYKVPANYRYSAPVYRDSLNEVDRPGQSLNLGVQFMKKTSAFGAFSIGLSYTDLTFRRQVTNLKIGYEVHPKVGVLAGVIQAGLLAVNYDFHYRYLEVPVMWYRSAEGYGNLRDFDLWYMYGFAPGILMQDRILIKTEGFTLNGTDRFSVKDDDIRGNPFNLMAHVGFRSQYHLYERIHGLFQPHLRIPVLPVSKGTQTMWIPQLTLDVGLVFMLGDD